MDNLKQTIILLVLLLSRKLARCGQAFIEERSYIPLSSIVDSIDNISAMRCILKCRRVPEKCKSAAMNAGVCLLISSLSCDKVKCDHAFILQKLELEGESMYVG